LEKVGPSICSYGVFPLALTLAIGTNGGILGSKSKRKGYAFEKEVVDFSRTQGFLAERAWGSNGRSKGWHEEVDVVVTLLQKQFKLQLKRRAKLGKHIVPSEHVDAQLIREDHGKRYLVIPYDSFLTLVKELIIQSQR